MSGEGNTTIFEKGEFLFVKVDVETGITELADRQQD